MSSSLASAVSSDIEPRPGSDVSLPDIAAGYATGLKNTPRVPPAGRRYPGVPSATARAPRKGGLCVRDVRRSAKAEAHGGYRRRVDHAGVVRRRLAIICRTLRAAHRLCWCLRLGGDDAMVPSDGDARLRQRSANSRRSWLP
jgi:hypothetical protein